MDTGGVALWKAADDQYAAAIKCCEDTLNSLEPSFCSDDSVSGEHLFTPRVPVKNNKYGPNVEVYISRSLKPAAGDTSLGSALATSTPIESAHNGLQHQQHQDQNGDGCVVRSSSPVRGVHFSPVVSEVNWRESYIEQENDGGHPMRHGNKPQAGRRMKKNEIEKVQDPPQRVTVTTTENTNRHAVQKIQVTSVPHPFGQPEPVITVAPSAPVVAATLPRSTSSTVTAATVGTGARVEPAVDPAEPTPIVIGKANGHSQKSATLPPKVQLVGDGKNSAKTNGKSSSGGKGSKKHSDEKIDDHQSIWKRLGIGRLSFGKSGKSSKQVNQKGVSAVHKDVEKEQKRSQEPIQSTPTRSSNGASEVTVIEIDVQKPVVTDPEEPTLNGSDKQGTEEDESTLKLPDSSTPASPSTSAASLPPRPPSSSLSTPLPAVSKHLSPVARARLIAAKKQFLAQQAAAVQSGAMATSPSKQPPLTAEEAAKSSENLRMAFERFRQKAEEDRRRLARSVPDLQEVESSVKEQMNAARKASDQAGVGGGELPNVAPTKLRAEMGKASEEFDKRWEEILGRSEIRRYGTKFERGRQAGRSSFSSDVGGGGERPDSTDASAAGHPHHGGGRLMQYPTAAQYFSDRYRSKSISGLRQDSCDENGELDSGEALFLRETHLGRFDGASGDAVGGNKLAISPDSAMKARSMMNLGERQLVEGDDEDGYDVTGRLGVPHRLSPTKGGPGVDDPYRAKSMEFLLDDENKEKIKPPENDLMQADRKMSEHELRFQKSLQRLNVPDWYKKSSANQQVNAAVSQQLQNRYHQRKPSVDSTSSNMSILPRRRAMDRVLPGGWEETKMASMSSLQSSRAGTPTRGRQARPIYEWRYGSSRDNVMSPDSTTSSPVPSERGLNMGGYQPPYYSRWGTTGAGRNSGSASPSSQFSAGGLSFISQRSYLSTASTNVGARKPYLGWRSQEKLAQMEKMQNGDATVNGTRQPLVVRTVSSNGSEAGSCVYLTPAERLARGLMASKQQQQQQKPPQQQKQEPQQPKAPEKPVESNGLTLSPSEVPELNPGLIRYSIKEVTNAIVHYCSEPEDDSQQKNNKERSPRPTEPPPPLPPRKPSIRSMSPDEETPVTVVRHQPRRRLPQWPPPPTSAPPSSSSKIAAPKRTVWVESSFVGNKPIASPETPTVGDVANLFDVSVSGSDDGFAREVSLDDYQQPELVPIEKLRTGSAQLNTFFGKRELRKPSVENGELWLQ